jgi:protein SCO1/2
MKAATARVLIMLSAFVAGLVLFSAIILLVSGRPSTSMAPQAAAIGGPFRLLDQDGKQTTEQDFKGKPFLVFFGFTHCPEVCPTALFEVSEIFRRLGTDADRARAVFITVDPERDTPQKLKDYLSSFDPHLSALTGDPAAIAAVTKSYRVYSKKVPLEGNEYTMDHTAIVYLMDKEGRFVAPFNLKRRSEEAATELRRYL